MSTPAFAGLSTNRRTILLRSTVSAILLALVATFFVALPAFAAERANSIITAASIIRSKAATSPLEGSERLEFRFDWDATNASPALAAGDTITVDLPTWAYFTNQTLPMDHPSIANLSFGDCVHTQGALPVTSKVVCTFNSNVENPEYQANLKGGLKSYIFLRSTTTITPTTFPVGPITVDIRSVATDEVVNNGIVAPSNPRQPQALPTEFSKHSGYAGLQHYTYGENILNWVVFVKGTGGEIVVRDPIPVPLVPSTYLQKNPVLTDYLHPGVDIVIDTRSISSEQNAGVVGSWSDPLRHDTANPPVGVALRLPKTKFQAAYSSEATDLGTQYTAVVTIPNSDPDLWYRIGIPSNAVPGTVRTGQTLSNTAFYDQQTATKTQAIGNFAEAWAAGDPTKGYIWLYKLVRPVDGAFEDAAAADQEFTIKYQINDGEVKSATFKVDSPYLIEAIDAGSVVKIWEDAPATTGNLVWTDAELRDGRVPGINPQPGVTIVDNDDSLPNWNSPTATVTVAAGKVYDLNFRNRYTSYTPFKVTKVVADPKPAQATGKAFDITYRCNAANKAGTYTADTEATVQVTDGQVVTVDEFPIGTVCTVVRESGQDITGYAASVELPTAPITLQVNPDSNVATITNTYRQAKVRVGDYVWHDVNNDGLQDDTDIPLEGVKLSISRSDGQLVTNADGSQRPVDDLSTLTDADGLYVFENLSVLPAGVHYVVSVETPAGGFMATHREAASDRTVDSSTDSAESTDLLNDGDKDMTLDFGFVKRAIDVEKYDGGVTWGGVQFDGRIADLTNGQPTVLPAGDRDLVGDALVVAPNKPVDVKFTVTNTGTVDLTNVVVSDETTAGPAIDGLVCVVDGANKPATNGEVDLGNWVFKAGTAFDCTGTMPALGDVKLHSDTAKVRGTALINSAPYGDPAEDEDSWHAKPTPRVSVGDYVWHDVNHDGLQDDTDVPIKGVELALTGPDGNPVTDVFGNTVGNTFTDASGKYVFRDLPAITQGAYTVTIVGGVDGLVPTKPGDGSNREKDSSTGSAASRVLPHDGDEDMSLDFGFVKPAVDIEKYDGEWEGLLAIDPATGQPTNLPDGDRDTAGEALLVGPKNTVPVSFTVTNTGTVGLINVVVWDNTDAGPAIEGLSCVVEGTTHDADPADGKVKLGAWEFPVGASFECSGTMPALGETKAHADTAFVEGTPAIDGQVLGEPVGDHDQWHAGLKPRVSVGDFVWFDNNGNGLQDPGEPGIEGVELKITYKDGTPVKDVNGDPVANVKTDKNGYYTFNDLPTVTGGNTYRVTVVAPPAGYEPTKAGVGSDRGKDSSTNYADSTTLPGDGDRDPSLDFGFIKTPTTTVPGKNLASTGTTVAGIAIGSLAALAAGAALLVLRRRQQH